VSWFKVDDRLTFHPKVLAAGNEAIGAWVRLGAYCGAHLTDGHLPSSIVLAVCGPDLARRLVAFRFLDELPDGSYAVHDYLEYNPTAEQVKAERAANAERQAKWRSGRNGVTNTVSNAAPVPSRSRSDPDQPSPDPKPTNQQTRPDVGLLAGWVDGLYAGFPRKGDKAKGATALEVLTDEERTRFSAAVSAYAQKVADEQTPARYVTTWPKFCEGKWRDYADADTSAKPIRRNGMGSVRAAVPQTREEKL
jgi:hypothetical protein